MTYKNTTYTQWEYC